MSYYNDQERDEAPLDCGTNVGMGMVPDKNEIHDMSFETTKRRTIINKIREHCIYAMYSLMDGRSETTRSMMDVEIFKKEAKDAYIGVTGRNDIACNLFHAKVECLVHAIWEEVYGK